MNWQEVVKLLRDIFVYADVQIVVYTLEDNGFHALSTDGDAEFYAADDIERCSEAFFLENRELESDFTKDAKCFQPTCDEPFLVLREKDYNNRLIDHYLQYQPKELFNYVKEFNFQYSDFADEEMIFLIDMSVDARDVQSQHKFDVGKTRQNFHVTHPMLNWNDNDLEMFPYSWGRTWKNYSHNWKMRISSVRGVTRTRWDRYLLSR